MLTPQEVSEHGFTKARRGGYSMEMVDEFLDQVTADYTTLFKENALLKNKMKVLADKIEEYRATDESMRRTLLAAQQVADELVEKTKAQCEEMISDAERDAKQRLEQLQQEVAAEEYRLEVAKTASCELTEELRQRYTRELAFLDTLPKMEPAPRQQKQQSPEFVAAAAADIEANIRIATGEGEEEPEAPAEEPPADTPAEAPPADTPTEAPVEENDGKTKELPSLAQRAEPAEEVEEPTRRIILPPQDTGDLPRSIDLDKLQFGKDYEVD